MTIGKRVGGRFISGQAGRAEDLGTTYFRSKRERNYARYLKFLAERNEIRKAEYEPVTFWFEGIKRGANSYKPDFRVTNNDGSVYYVEVKGYLSSRDKTKHKRMAKYFPQIKLIIVGNAEWKSIAEWAAVIPGWER